MSVDTWLIEDQTYVVKIASHRTPDKQGDGIWIQRFTAAANTDRRHQQQDTG